MLAPLIPARLCSARTMHSDAAAPALFAALTPPCRGIYGDTNVDCELAATPRLCSAQNDIRTTIQFNDVYTHTHMHVQMAGERQTVTYGPGRGGARHRFCCKKGEEIVFKAQYWQYFTKILMSVTYGKVQIIMELNSI